LKLKNFKMTRKLYSYLLTAMLFLILTSCSKDNGTGSLIEDKLESMSGKEMLRELLIKNDNDVNQLARIFECSPSSLRRIVEGKETIATPNAIIEFKNILHQVLVTKEKNLDELDPYNQTWYKKIFFFLKNRIGTIAICYLIVFIIFIFFDLPDIALRIFFYSLYIIIICFLITFIANFFADKIITVDNFKHNIDTIWEKPILR